ncbi:unnamed protein product [Dibothriocephalus latus]|uniref:Uncharacterized protein n=1 Tax=Dibothriocephalus latus TaxID=60516 RepID=A0A3P6V0Z3_DIBLA|nr:unnamed protein product [Dibothriocephalus latus]
MPATYFNFFSPLPLKDLYTRAGGVTTMKCPLEESVQKNGTGVESKCRAQIRRLSAGLSLAVCYAASCGGIATLIGSPPNTIFAGLACSRYGHDVPPNFGTWMLFSLPISLLCLTAAWVVLCLMFLGPSNLFICCKKRSQYAANPFQRELCEKPYSTKRTESKEELEPHNDKEDCDDEVSINVVSILRRISEAERQALGYMKFGEKACLILFVLLIVLWITREPDVPGWSRFMPTGNSSSGKTVTKPNCRVIIKPTTNMDDEIAASTDAEAGCQAIIASIMTPSEDHGVIPVTSVVSRSNYSLEQGDITVKIPDTVVDGVFRWYVSELGFQYAFLASAEEDENARKRINSSLVTWELVQSRISWGVLILMGGGFALAEVVFVSYSD